MKRFCIGLLISGIFAGCAPSSEDGSVEEVLKNIDNREEAEGLREEHPEWIIDVLEATTDGRPPNENLSRILAGEVVEVTDAEGTFHHKLLQLDSATQYNMRYIFFSGTELTQEQIDTRRSMVLERYHNGQPFGELANQFTMDGNTTGGDLGWLDEEDLQPEFTAAMRSHKKGDVFPVDIPDKGFHYLVLKYQEERVILRMEILKVGVKEEE